MRNIFVLLILLNLLTSTFSGAQVVSNPSSNTSNVVRNSNWCYVTSTPTWDLAVNANQCRNAYNYVTGELWLWESTKLGNGAWVLKGMVTRISGTGTPAYTPTNPNEIAINGNGQVFAWNGSIWVTNTVIGESTTVTNTATIIHTGVLPNIVAAVAPASVDSTHLKEGGVGLGDLSAEVRDSIKKDVRTDFLVGTTAFDTLAPLSGWTAPLSPIAGNTVEVKFTDCKIANYTYDGTAWVFKHMTDYVDLGKEQAITLPSFSGTGWTGSGAGPYTATGLNTNQLVANVILDDGETYILRCDVVIAGGALYAYVGGERRVLGSSGNHVNYFTVHSDNRVLFEKQDGGFTGTVSNITLHKVIGCEQIYNTKSRFMSSIHVNDGQIETDNGANIAIGYNVARNNTLDIYNILGSNIAVGNSAGNDGSATVVGYFAGNKNEAGGALTAFGKWAGSQNTTGHASFFGNACGRSNTTSNSHGFGDECLGANQTGEMSSFGYYALNKATSGSQSAFGKQALQNALSGNSTAMGHYSARSNETGSITSFGAFSGERYSGGAVSGGIFIGEYAGVNPGTNDFSYTVEDNVIVIGNRSRKTDTSPMPNTILIGNDIRANTSNQIKIGTSNTSNYLDLTNGFLGVNKAANSLYRVDAEGDVNNIQGFRITNKNTGTSASSAFVLANSTTSATFGRTDNGLLTINNSTGSDTRLIPGTSFRLYVSNIDKFIFNATGLGVNNSSPATALDVTGTIRSSTLAGTGTRMVTATSVGDLSTAALPVGMPTATAANQIPVSTGAGTTYTATDINTLFSSLPTFTAATSDAANTAATVAIGQQFWWKPSSGLGKVLMQKE